MTRSTSIMTRSYGSLRRALTTNAVFSGVSGLSLLIFANLIFLYFGLPNGVIMYILGGGLIGYAGILFWGSNQSNEILEKVGIFAIIGDDLWVLGSIALLIIRPTAIQMTGYVIIIIIALIVGILSIWQLNSIIDPSQTIQMSRSIKAPKDIAWEVVSEIDDYHRFAPTISNSEVIEGTEKKEGMKRRCWDEKGNSWTEECILYQENQKYTFDVNTDELNLPLNKLQGTFGVNSNGKDNNGEYSELFMQFEIIPRFGMLGKLLLKLREKKSKQEIEAVLDNWEQEIQNMI